MKQEAGSRPLGSLGSHAFTALRLREHLSASYTQRNVLAIVRCECFFDDGASAVATFGCIALFLAIKLRGDVESPRAVWNETAATCIIFVNYTVVVAGVVVLFCIAKRGQQRYEPIVHFRGYDGSDEDNPARRASLGPLPSRSLTCVYGSRGSGDDGLRPSSSQRRFNGPWLALR